MFFFPTPLFCCAKNGCAMSLTVTFEVHSPVFVDQIATTALADENVKRPTKNNLAVWKGLSHRVKSSYKQGRNSDCSFNSYERKGAMPHKKIRARTQ